MAKSYIFDALKKEEKRNLLSSVTLRVVCTKGELEYSMIPKEDRTLGDKLAFFQSVVNSLRIHDFGANSQAMFRALYKQGILFDHTQAALNDGDTNPHADYRTWQEIADSPPKKKKKKMTELDFLDMWLVPDKPQHMKEKDNA